MGGLISESFHFGSNLQKKGCQITTLNTTYPPEEKILSVVIWYIFWRFEPKWKTF